MLADPTVSTVKEAENKQLRKIDPPLRKFDLQLPWCSADVIGIINQSRRKRRDVYAKRRNVKISNNICRPSWKLWVKLPHLSVFYASLIVDTVVDQLSREPSPLWDYIESTPPSSSQDILAVSATSAPVYLLASLIHLVGIMRRRSGQSVQWSKMHKH